jgi:hypothetical protein
VYTLLYHLPSFLDSPDLLAVLSLESPVLFQGREKAETSSHNNNVDESRDLSVVSGRWNLERERELTAAKTCKSIKVSIDKTLHETSRGSAIERKVKTVIGCLFSLPGLSTVLYTAVVVVVVESATLVRSSPSPLFRLPAVFFSRLGSVVFCLDLCLSSLTLPEVRFGSI